MLSHLLAPRLARRGIHYGWVMVVVTFLNMLSTAAAMAMPGVLMAPLRAEFGWQVSAVSGPLALRLALYGLMGPFAAALIASFTAPYARGHGLARMLTRRAEEAARALGYHVLNLDVRETQAAAIRLYESMGYIRWGEHPAYARVAGQTLRGIYYYKTLRSD